MRADTQNKSCRMLAKEERKLAKLTVELLERLGFKIEESNGLNPTYVRHSDRFACRFVVRPIVGELCGNDCDGWPWLACRFEREKPRPDLPWDAPENYTKYRDVNTALGCGLDLVNVHSGKYNCHTHARVTAEEAIRQFEWHLRSAIEKPAA